jgi:hypothetical protein
LRWQFFPSVVDPDAVGSVDPEGRIPEPNRIHEDQNSLEGFPVPIFILKKFVFVFVILVRVAGHDED